jgi:drug/metabolite transporter (DMT)-like permease
MNDLEMERIVEISSWGTPCYRYQMRTLSRKDWILLILITLFWGINWPIMKIGVTEFPPITFRALCMIGALPTIWLTAQLSGNSLRISQRQIAIIMKLALPNMLVWHFFVILGVKMLASGRAAILGFTMPVWAVLSGLLFFRERVTPLAWLGVGCALAGALLLLSSEFSALTGQPLGSALVLVAAAGWGYGTVALRKSSIDISTISLTFWMIAMTAVAMGVAAILFERSAWRWPNAIEWAAIIFNALIVVAFANIVWVQLARSLPPIASSLSVMMIPIIGVFSGALVLGETPHWQDYAAMVLILAAMSTVLLKPRANAIE